MHDGSLTSDNGVFLSNTATQGGALWAGKHASASLRHASLSSSAAASGAAAWSDGSLTIIDTYVADHQLGTAIAANSDEDALTTYSAYWNNPEGDFDGNTESDDTNLFEDSQIPAPPSNSCDPLLLVPPLSSPLIGAGTYESDIGAFGGPLTWIDGDGDGSLSLSDCNDEDGSISPDADELAADGIDQDCDGTELCYADEDGDGYGDLELQESSDLDCDDLGEASNSNESCPGDDAADDDSDGVANGCDLCPDDPLDDTDGDSVCDSADQCPDADDASDADVDGIPDGCDPCPSDPDLDCTSSTLPETSTDPGALSSRKAPEGVGCQCDSTSRSQQPFWLVISLMMCVSFKRRL